MSSSDQSAMRAAVDLSPVRWRRLLALSLLVYWIALFIGTHIPLPEVAPFPRNTDKWMHFGAYAGLTYLLGLWLWATGRTQVRHTLWLMAGLACYAVADELLQIPVHRHADVYDGLCDWLGIAVGVAAIFITRRLVARLRNPAT